MQTFLPYPDFKESAKVLDYRRLGKQRVEAYQILLILTGKSGKKGWRNHPAVKMWRGYENSLFHYTLTIINEWKRRGYNDTMYQKILEMYLEYEHFCVYAKHPPFVGNKDFHRAHQSNLLRKDAKFYGPKFPGIPDDLPYIWPVQ